MKEWIKTASRIIVAVVFIFSGFVKCVDPTGTAIKFEEYFAVFGMDFMAPLCMALSLLMCGAELLIGIALLLNLRISLSAWLAAAMMIVYTPLTLWLAISNKVTDCGCFGDALVLTNTQTFLKNLVIDIFVVILVLNRKNYRHLIKPHIQWAAVAGLALLITWFEFYNLNHLPVIDFMPYKVGTNIPRSMVVPEGAPRDSFRMVLMYEKNGKTEKFSQDNYPQNDPSWKFVDSKSILVRKGYTPPIHDFSILSSDGQDLTDLILSDPGYTLFVVFNAFKKADLSHIAEINRVVNLAVTKGYKVIGLTSSVPEEFEVFKEKAKAAYPMYLVDNTTLKTMIRANPGLVLIKGGTIMGKWHNKQVGKIKSI